ncbi:MAG: hypothetical protein H0T47_15400 [Planctomycetaceae bacterium]|nr:hypothetical protein [Planctomycetaceae bacterium]
MEPNDSDLGDMRADYDFSDEAGVEIGKYSGAYNSRLRIVKLDDDIAERFPDAESVNAALREYLAGHEPARG